MKTIIFTHAAAKDLDGLPVEGRQQVENALVRYAASGEGDVKQLAGREGYRLRTGRYRVLFDEVWERPALSKRDRSLVTVAALTVYDMLKAAEKSMRIEGVRLIRKTGGKSGTYEAAP